MLSSLVGVSLDEEACRSQAAGFGIFGSGGASFNEIDLLKSAGRVALREPERYARRDRGPQPQDRSARPVRFPADR